MLSVKDSTPLSHFDQLDDKKYHIDLMAYHLNNIHSSIKEIHCDLERLLTHLSEFEEAFHEDK